MRFDTSWFSVLNKELLVVIRKLVEFVGIPSCCELSSFSSSPSLSMSPSLLCMLSGDFVFNLFGEVQTLVAVEGVTPCCSVMDVKVVKSMPPFSVSSVTGVTDTDDLVHIEEGSLLRRGQTEGPFGVFHTTNRELSCWPSIRKDFRVLATLPLVPSAGSFMVLFESDGLLFLLFLLPLWLLLDPRLLLL